MKILRILFKLLLFFIFVKIGMVKTFLLSYFRSENVTSESAKKSSSSTESGSKSQSSGLSKAAAPSIVHYKRRRSTPSSNLYVTSSVQTPPNSSKSNLPAQGMQMIWMHLICLILSLVTLVN